MNPEIVPVAERRAHPRKQIKTVAYLALGGGNGGIVINLSESGMAVQAAVPVVDNIFPRLTFLLGQIQVQARGAIVWKSASKTIVGVSFTEMPAETRAQIVDWVADKEQTRLASERPVAEPRRVEISKSGSEPFGPNLTTADISKSAAREVSPVAAPVGSEAPEHANSHADFSATRIKRVRARLKRYLVSERERIRLRDLVSQETAALRHFLAETEFSPHVPVTTEEVMHRLQAYESQSQVLVTIMSMGCFWGERVHDSTWARIVEHVQNSVGSSGDAKWNFLRSYPALLLFYAGGLAALAEGKNSTLKALLFEPRFASAAPELTAQSMKATVLLENKKAADSELNLGRHLRLSVRLHDYLRDPLREFVPFEADYDELFDRFEYLLALLWIDDNPQSIKFDWIPTEAPLGRFAGDPSHGERMSISRVLAGEIAERGRDLPLLREGFFGGSLQRLQLAQKRVDRLLASDESAGRVEAPAYLK